MTFSVSVRFLFAFLLALGMNFKSAFADYDGPTPAPTPTTTPRMALSWSQLLTYFNRGIIPVYEKDQNGNETTLKGHWVIDLAPGAATAAETFAKKTKTIGVDAAKQWISSFKQMGNYISLDYYKAHVYEELKNGYTIAKDVNSHGMCNIISDLRSQGQNFADYQSRINKDDFGAWGSTLWNWASWLASSAFYICGRTLITFSAPVLGAAWAITVPTYYMIKPAVGSALKITFRGVLEPVVKEGFSGAVFGMKEGWNVLHFTATSVGAKVPNHDQWNVHFVQSTELPQL